jgi:cell division protease FtsH
VRMLDFNEAIERGAVGLERKSRIMSVEEKRRVAYHEAGHAMVTCALPNTHVVHKVSIIPRGVGALGYVLHRPEEDRYLITQSELESLIKVDLGGTLAEEIVFGEISSGATNDLEKANQIARRMVKEFGMSRLGRVNFREGTGSAFLGGSGFSEGDHYSQQTAHEIDLEVRRILDEATREVRAILQTRRPALEALALRLIDKEVIEGDELRQLIEEYHPGPKLVHASAAIGPAAVEEEIPSIRSDGTAAKSDG